MKIAMTGASGNMGREALAQTLELRDVEFVRVLLSPRKKNDKTEKKLKKKYGKRIQFVRGDIANAIVCQHLVEGVDYVLHMAAVIPPASDRSEKNSYVCNLQGAVTLVESIKRCNPQPKYVHISTVALYGNRNEVHPWARVGDPLLVSPFDPYAMHKLYGERYALEAGLDQWVVLRQTAMLHPNMLKDNVSDGLMFHTAVNAPLEWVSSRDSGYLVKRIFERDGKGEIPYFWKKIYNIGAGFRGRETGYDTFGDGFAIIGGSAEKFFKPHWLATRNFHGVWFADADELEELFAYQRDGVKDYWKEIARRHRIYALGKIVPAPLINLFLFKRLLNHPNSPRRWLKNGDRARVQAAFGSEKEARALPTKWKDVKLMAKGDFGDYDEMRKIENAPKYRLDHGYDESKAQEEWNEEDLRSAAKFRGGEFAGGGYQGAYSPVLWRCYDGHEFHLTPYTVLRGGHWCPQCTQPAPWDFDRQAKHNPFFAQVWYDSHRKNENVRYDIDDGGNATVTPIEDAE